MHNVERQLPPFTPIAQPVRRNRIFDLLRLAFATCVLLSHAYELSAGSRLHEPLSVLTHGGMSFGEFGVKGFFLLSGYLITQSWLGDPHLGSFALKRVLRIVPGYLVAALLSIVVIGLVAPAAPHFFHMPGLKALLSVVCLGSPLTSGVFPGRKLGLVNGAMWTIPFECRCYALVALAGVTRLLKQRYAVLAIVVILFFAGHLPYVKTHPQPPSNLYLLPDLFWTIRLTAFFAVGACFYLFRDRIRFRPALFWAALGGLAAFLIFLPRHFESGLFLFGSYLVFYLAQYPFSALNRLRMPDISYGLYLYGWPVECLWIYFRHDSPLVIFAGCFVLSACCGWLSWHFVERPMLKRKRHPTAALPQP